MNPRSQLRVAAGALGGVALLWLVIFTLDKLSAQPAVSAWLVNFSKAAGVHSLASTWYLVSRDTHATVYHINEYVDKQGKDFRFTGAVEIVEFGVSTPQALLIECASRTTLCSPKVSL